MKQINHKDKPSLFNVNKLNIFKRPTYDVIYRISKLFAEGFQRSCLKLLFYIIQNITPQSQAWLFLFPGHNMSKPRLRVTWFFTYILNNLINIIIKNSEAQSVNSWHVHKIEVLHKVCSMIPLESELVTL